MDTVYFKGTPCHTFGQMPAAGSKAPSFNLAGADLSPVKSADYEGNTVVLNIFPSLDTDVCARSVRKFNEEAASLKDTVVVCASMDLPFAMGRFCTANAIENVTVGSAFRSPLFGQEYGVQLCDGPLAGLLARAVVVIGPDGRVKYRELVHEITDEPDYAAAISAIKE